MNSRRFFILDRSTTLWYLSKMKIVRNAATRFVACAGTNAAKWVAAVANISCVASMSCWMGGRETSKVFWEVLTDGSQGLGDLLEGALYRPPLAGVPA